MADEPGPERDDGNIARPTREPHVWARRVYRISFVAFVLSLSALLVLGVQYLELKRSRLESTVEEARVASALAAQDLEKVMDAVEDYARSLAEPASRAEIAERLGSVLEECPQAEGAGLMQQDGTGWRVERAGPRADAVVKPIDVAFAATLKGKSKGWQSFVYKHKFGIRCVQPFPGGLAFIDLDVDMLVVLVNGISVGEVGYCVVLDPDGRLLVAPEMELALGGMSIADIAQRTDGFKKLAALPLPAGPMQLEDRDIYIPRSMLLQPVQPAGWTIVAVVSLGDRETRALLGRVLLGGGLATMGTLLFLLFGLLARSYREGTRRLWGGSVGASVLIFATVVWVWYLVLGGMLPQQDPSSLRLTDANAVEQFKADYSRLCRSMNQLPPAYVPTGVWVKSLEFSSANNIHMTGVIWQKYYYGVHDEVKRGVTLPEGVNIKLDEIYRVKRRDYEVVGWLFQGVLRQRFDYSRYPLDVASVWVRIWPAGLSTSVLPVPDVESYNIMRPAALPGVQDELVLAGWTLESSVFEYRDHFYDTDFGVEGNHSSFASDLYFTIDVRRDFMNAFVLNLVPLLVIASLLFTLVLTTTYDESRSGAFGFKPSGVLGTCSGLLFAALLAHSKLRSDLAAQTGIIYLETFYFILYMLIVLVALNSFLVASRARSPLFEFEDNVVPKIVFWPALLLAVLGLTLWFVR